MPYHRDVFVLRLSIWIALLAWLAGPASAFVGRGHMRWQRTARALWTLGCAAYLVHVAAAFQVVHGWSHAAAYEATLRDTAATTGFESGFGLWLNYLFTVLWTVDAASWWWLGLDGYRRRARWITDALYGFMLFMTLNATVVFEDGWVRAFGFAGCLLLAGLAARRVFRTRFRPNLPAGPLVGDGRIRRRSHR